MGRGRGKACRTLYPTSFRFLNQAWCWWPRNFCASGATPAKRGADPDKPPGATPGATVGATLGKDDLAPDGETRVCDDDLLTAADNPATCKNAPASGDDIPIPVFEHSAVVKYFSWFELFLGFMCSITRFRAQ